MTVDSLGKRLTPPLQGQGRAMEAIVAVLSSLDLIRVVPVEEEEEEQGNVRRLRRRQVLLTEAARQVLLKDSPFYWGAQLLAADGITASLRMAVHRDGRQATRNVVDYAGDHSVASIDSFIDSMQAHGSVTAWAATQALEPVVGPGAPQPAQHILDMAGGSGCFAQALRSQLPASVRITLADVPSVVARFRRQQPPHHHHHHHPNPPIDSVPADLFQESTWPVGPDTHLLANVLHDWGEAQVADILRASRNALEKRSASNSGPGRLIVIEQLLSDDRSGPLPVALASVSMLLGDWRTGKQYSFAELRHHLQRAGFARVELGPKCGNFHVAVIAYTE